MLQDRRIITILLIIFVQFLGASMVLPILPLYAQREFALSPEIITVLVSSFFAAQFLAGPYIGRLSDGYGRVPVLIVSQAGTVISFLLLAAANSVEVLFVARILDGITGGNVIVAQAYVTDLYPREQRTQALGYTLAVFGLGFVFGPAIGGLLSAVFGPRMPFVFAALAATLTVVLTWYTLDETLSPEEREENRHARLQPESRLSPRAVMLNTPLVLILVISFGGQFGLGLVQATFALLGEAVWFKGASNATTDLGIGLLLGAVGLGQFFTQMMLLGRFRRWFGDPQLVILGTLLRGVAMITWAVVLSPYPVGVAGIIFAIGSGLFRPPLQSLATQTVDDRERGAALGLFQSSISLATIVATAIGGTLFALGMTVPYWLGGLLFFAMAIPSTLIQRWATANDVPTGLLRLPQSGD